MSLQRFFDFVRLKGIEREVPNPVVYCKNLYGLIRDICVRRGKSNGHFKFGIDDGGGVFNTVSK